MKIDSIHDGTRDVTTLLASSLISSACFGAMFVALPFRMGHLDGSDVDVGILGALYTLFYVAAMLLSRSLLHRRIEREIAMVGSTLLAGAAVMIALSGTKMSLCMAVSAYGVATAWHWPPIMGLISGGVEGKALNRRLGWFNATWSSGLIIGPYLGGWLYDINPQLVFLFIAGIHMICAVLAFCTTPQRQSQVLDEQQLCHNKISVETHVSSIRTIEIGDEQSLQNAVYRRMARVALVCSYMVVGLLRYQMPVLAERELSISPTTFGTIGSIFSASQAAGFIILGWSPIWHFRPVWMWVIQALLGTTLLFAWYATSATGLILCSLFAGFGVSFLYASHLFYGVSGGQHRSRLMSIHEILLSVGFMLGALLGGIIALWAGRRQPYMFFFVMMIIGVVVEIVIYRCKGKR